MSDQKETRGRKKNPTTVKLERKIKKLEEEIEHLQIDAKKIAEDNGKDLTCRAYGVILAPDDNGKRVYQLVELKFDPVTRQALVVNIEYLADTPYRMEYEFKKMIISTDQHINIIQ